MSCKDRSGVKRYLPEDVKKKYGIDHRMLEGPRGRNMGEILLAARDGVSSAGMMKKFIVRYKPKEVVAFFIDSEHLVDAGQGKMKPRRQGGWLVLGPNNHLFYVEEGRFATFFEIVEESDVDL